LINFGIVPLTFKDPVDYDRIDVGDTIGVVIGGLRDDVRLRNLTKDTEIELTHALSPLDAEIVKTGGKLPWVKAKVEKR
jgi:aconitate hydratase